MIFRNESRQIHRREDAWQAAQITIG